MPLPFLAIPQQVHAEEGYVDLGDVRLWHWDTGGSGDVVLLCHPASQSCRIWLYQQPVLAAAGYRVIAYSRRGVYRSQPGPRDRPGTAVDDMARLLDHLDVERAHLVGAAAGGISALGFAVAHEQRAASLTLVGTIFSPDEDEWRQMYANLGLAAVRGVVSTEFLELGPSYRATNPEGTRRFLELEHQAKAGGPAIQQPVGARVNWANLAVMRVPTLLVTGEADLYAPPPLQALVARRMALQKSHTLRQVGHAPYWEVPDVFNRLLLEFLEHSHPTARDEST